MAIEIVMPKLSDTMEEGKILKWLKNVGDKIELMKKKSPNHSLLAIDY